MRLVGLLLSLLVVLLSTPSWAVNRLAIATPSALFNRPFDTTTYGIGELVANSTTAANVVPMSWNIVSLPKNGVFIRRVNIRKQSLGVVTPNFRLHLFTTSPTVTNGDNGAYASTSVGWFCDMDVNMYTTDPFNDANAGIGVPNNGAECAVVPTANTIYGLLEARGAYVPQSGELFTVTLEVYGPGASGGGTPATPSWVMSGAALDYDFVNQQYWYSGRDTSNLMTTTRASVGYAQNSAGLLLLFASGLPRITDKGLLVEEGRTNLALWSRDMTNAAWTATDMTVAQTATGADGTLNAASTLTSTATNSTVLQSVTAGAAFYTYSVWLKRLSGTGLVQFTVDNGTTWTTAVLTSSYQQFQVPKSAANPVFGIRIVTSGDSVAADFNQTEAGSFATSPIVTTTVSVARAADVITLPASTPLVTTPISMYAAVNIPQTNGVLNWRVLEITDAATSAHIRNNAATTWIGVLSAGTVNGTTVTTGRHKLAARQALNDLNISVDGSISTAITSAANMITFVRIEVGNTQTASPRQLNGYMERMAIYNSALSDKSLRALTSP